MIHKISKVLALLACCALPAAATNIVQNPGFEDGASHWTASSFLIDDYPMWAHTGPGMAMTACVGVRCVDSLMSGAYISQLLPTEAGAQYDLSFWIRSYLGLGEYSVFWDGAMVDDIIHAPNGPMMQARFTGLYASANATLLEVHGRNDPNLIAFDDFSVVRSATPVYLPPSASPQQDTAISEPETFLLVLGGLCVLASVAHRRR
ncbi:MAG: hypothetical protein ACXW3B_04445 [Telluria sp.]